MHRCINGDAREGAKQRYGSGGLMEMHGIYRRYQVARECLGKTRGIIELALTSVLGSGAWS